MLAKYLLVLLMVSTLSACSMVAPKYTPSVANISQLKMAKLKPLAIGRISADPALGSNNDSIGLRGSSMSSPYGSYTIYLEEALRSEFQAAGLFDAAAGTRVTGTLIKNDVSVGGFTTGDAIIEARIQVIRDSLVTYDKVKTAVIQFESSFAGAVAIPKGRDMYPVVAQKFIEQLAADPDFIGSLK